MKFNEIINEDQFLWEMANLTSRSHGIDNIVIWVGGNPDTHYMRIKVSNVPNKYSNNNFTITIPDLQVIGNINKQFISGKILEDIKYWIKLNMETLIDFEKGNIIDTGEFHEKIVKIQ